MNEFNLRSVFYHELGHFVAHSINKISLGGLGVKAIIIFPETRDDRHGHNELNKPEGYVEGTPVPKIRLAQYLVSVAYGCIFQSYYENQLSAGSPGKKGIASFDNCFHHNGAGVSDVKKWYQGLYANGLSGYNSDFFALLMRYFQELSEKHSLAAFMSLNLLDYLNEYEIVNFSIDLDKLFADCEDLIKAHIDQYLSLVAEFDKLIKSISD
jgi:hypothetical protein